MNKPLVIGMSLAVLLVSGCVDREAEARKVKAEAEAEAKARAEAARKEMDTAPTVFQNRDYFERNEPAKKPAPEKKSDSDAQKSKQKP